MERELEAVCKRSSFGEGSSKVKETETTSGVERWLM